MGIPILEGYLPVFEFEDMVVAERDAEDIGSEVLEGLLSGSYGLGVDDPVLLPHLLGDVRVEVRFLERVAELGSEDDRQRLYGHQEGVASRPPFSGGRESSSRYDVVNMRMIP